MAKTVIGLFDQPDRARQAANELLSSGFSREEMFLVDQQMLRGGGEEPDLVRDELTSNGVPDDDARRCLDAINSGCTLIGLHTGDSEADRAAEMLDRHGAMDLDEVSRKGGAQTGQRTAQKQPQQQPMRQQQPMGGKTAGRKAGEEIREAVVEEDVRIGKRQIPGGGVRVFSRVTERPIHENIRLREERIDVQRRPVDRPATPQDLKKGQEEVVVRAQSEEAVVQKQPRVVEEVVVSKDVQERTEEITETARRKDVEVQPIAGREAGQQQPLDLDPDFQQHYQRSFGGQGRFETVAPAYQYGSQLGRDPKFQGREWDRVRDDARRDWEQRNPGTFDRMENAIRYGYDRGSGR